MSALRKKSTGLDARLLQEIIDVGTLLMRARYGAMGLLNDQRTAFEHFITAADGGGEAAPLGPLPRGWGLLDAIIQDPRPIRLIASRAHGSDGQEDPPRSFLGIPIASGGKVWGNFYFAEKEGAAEFRPSDERLAECFSRLALDALQGSAFRAEVTRALRLYRGAVEEPGAAVITNPAREIVFWNGGARRLFGYTEREALGRHFADLLVLPNERAGWRNGFDPRVMRRLQDGEETQIEGVRLRKDGRKIRVRSSLCSICHQVAGIVAITCVGRYERI